MNTAPDVVELADRLRTAVTLLRRHMRDADPDGLSVSQLSTLVRLDRDGPRTSADLARAEAVSPQSMGTIVRSLHERGLTSRTADTKDGRRMLVSATPKGRELLETRTRQRQDHIAAALREELSSAELHRLPDLLAQLERVARRLGGEPAHRAPVRVAK